MDFYTIVVVILCSTVQLPVSISDVTVKYPFGLEVQFGQRVFTLKQNNRSEIVLNIHQSAGDFVVQRIDYNVQTIELKSSDGCYPDPNLDGYLRSSPFTMPDSAYYKFFNCPTNFTSSTDSIKTTTCLKNVTRVAVPSNSTGEVLNQTDTCEFTGEFRVSMWSSLYDVLLAWSTPNCSACYQSGGTCYGVSGSYVRNTVCSNSYLVPYQTPAALISDKSSINMVWIPLIIFAIIICCGLCGCSCLASRSSIDEDIEAVPAVAWPYPVRSDEDEARVKPNIVPVVLGQSMRFTGTEETCSICLAEFEPLQTVATVPSCQHVFHHDCLDEWLTKSHKCPLCRSSPDELT